MGVVRGLAISPGSSALSPPPEVARSHIWGCQGNREGRACLFRHFLLEVEDLNLKPARAQEHTGAVSRLGLVRPGDVRREARVGFRLCWHEVTLVARAVRKDLGAVLSAPLRSSCSEHMALRCPPATPGAGLWHPTCPRAHCVPAEREPSPASQAFWGHWRWLPMCGH